MTEYIQVNSNGQITLPVFKDGDFPEVGVDVDETIRLQQKLAVDRSLAEEYQIEDVSWTIT